MKKTILIEAFNNKPSWLKDKSSSTKPYTSEDQWEDEIRIFMNGLKSGRAIEFGDKSIGVEWKVDLSSQYENDPRFIIFDYGDSRLRDDHFTVQHSRRLTDDELRDIRDYMVRMGMVDKHEFDMDYGLNSDYSFYESKINNIVRDVLNEAMYRNVPDDGNIPPFAGRRPKSIKSRMNQIYSLVNKYGLSSRLYHDDAWKAVSDYKKIIESMGYKVSFSVDNGGYGDYDPNDNMPRSKTYNILIEAEDGMEIEGYVKMMAAGSVKDPFDAYDTCMVLWPKPKRRYDESLIKQTFGELLKEWDANDPDEGPEDWAEHRTINEFTGIYDIDTDEVFGYDMAPSIDGDEHRFVIFSAMPDDYEIEDDEGDYWTPGSYSVDIRSYGIYPDNMMYLTDNGDYIENDETAQPFNGFSKEQIRNIENYLQKNIDIDYWGLNKM